jgi:predicted anti-sigma-YlaC factor YlaD
MSPSSTDCGSIREALPEFALGIADGKQHARALEHVAGCSDCHDELELLSSVARDLTALAPQREPPLGFESRAGRACPSDETAPARSRMLTSSSPAAK